MAPAKSVDFPAGADDGCSAPGPNEGGEGHRDDVEAGGTAIAPAPATTMLRPRCQRGRLASLDVFRGITVVVSKSSASPLATFLLVQRYASTRAHVCSLTAAMDMVKHLLVRAEARRPGSLRTRRCGCPHDIQGVFF